MIDDPHGQIAMALRCLITQYLRRSRPNLKAAFGCCASFEEFLGC